MIIASRIAIATVLACFALLARAQTITVLNPGPGTSYMATSCGGQSVNAVAEDFNDSGQPVTLVTVSTRCGLSGRGAKSRNYLTCARVTYSVNGLSIVGKEIIASGSWLAGSPSTVFCPAADAGAVYIRDAAMLSTSSFPSGSRAVLTQP